MQYKNQFVISNGDNAKKKKEKLTPESNNVS